ncbi:MAG: hypothetical protein K8F29_08375 [Kofleriaceae bacterium]|nr:hypothetical protein [Candidatus Methylomirabilis lanthanidiphila]
MHLSAIDRIHQIEKLRPEFGTASRLDILQNYCPYLGTGCLLQFRDNPFSEFCTWGSSQVGKKFGASSIAFRLIRRSKLAA